MIEPTWCCWTAGTYGATNSVLERVGVRRRRRPGRSGSRCRRCRSSCRRRRRSAWRWRGCGCWRPARSRGDRVRVADRLGVGPWKPSISVSISSTRRGSSPNDSYVRPQRSSRATQRHGANAHCGPVARVSSAVICALLRGERRVARGAHADVVREDRGADHVAVAVDRVLAVDQRDLQRAWPGCAARSCRPCPPSRPACWASARRRRRTGSSRPSTRGCRSPSCCSWSSAPGLPNCVRSACVIWPTFSCWRHARQQVGDPRRDRQRRVQVREAVRVDDHGRRIVLDRHRAACCVASLASAMLIVSATDGALFAAVWTGAVMTVPAVAPAGKVTEPVAAV